MFFYGNFALISPASLLQILCQEQRSVILSAQHGSRKAIVQLANGSIVNAHCDDLSGPEAVYDLLVWTWGQFHLKFDNNPPSETNISLSWERLLLEGARRRDETNTAEAPLSTGPSRQQLIALLEVCPALAGVALVSYDGRLLAHVELHDPTIVTAIPTLVGGLATIGTALGGNKTVAIYVNGRYQLLLTEWDAQTLVLAIPTPGASMRDATSQLASWAGIPS